MASNIKALTGVLKNNLLNIGIRVLSGKEIGAVFIQKDNDTADILKDRLIYTIQQNIASTESNLRKNTDIIKYVVDYELHDVYTEAAERLIADNNPGNGIELINGFFANPAAKTKLTENPAIKMQLDFILMKSDFQHISIELQRELTAFKKGQDPKKFKELMLKLDNIDKQLAQSFSSIAATLNLADKTDNLRAEISAMIMRSRIRLIEKSKGDRKAKQTEFTALMQFYKDSLQKKSSFFLARQQKITEIIGTLQSKIIININKIKAVDLSKSIQLYLKFNNEIIKLDEALHESLRTYAAAAERDTLGGKILEQQRGLVDKLNNLEQYTKVLNAKAPPAAIKEINDLMVFYEEFSYLQTKINRYKRFLQEETDDLSSIFSQLYRIELDAGRPSLYRGDKINYRQLRYYLESSLSKANSALLYVEAKAGATASIYVLPEAISFYGPVTVEAEHYAGSKIKLNFSGYTGYRADSIAGTEEAVSRTKLKTRVSYIFNDFDDATKFILSGFKKYDLFNRLQQVKQLSHV